MPTAASPLQTTPSRPLRSAKQQRSRLLMQSIREAAIELLAAMGAANITTVKIAERAGVSIGSLYRYYPNKEAILADIYEERLRALDEQLRAHLRPSSDTEPLRALLRESVERTVGVHCELLLLDANFFIAFQSNFNLADRQGPVHGDSWGAWTERWLLDVLRHNRGQVKVTDLPAAARLIIDMVYGTLARIIATRPETLQGTQLTDELTAMITGYLCVD